MAVIRCSKGHYYDNEKFSQCPHCGIFSGEDDEKTMAMPADSLGVGAISDEDKTVAMTPIIPGSGQMRAAAPIPETEEDDKTISLYAQEKGVDFIVGWLVCIEGPERGRDYRLHQGFNRIGRDYSMDVAVMEDMSIGREATCAVVYDDKSNHFFAVQQPGANAYLNGAALEGAVGLNTGDRIRVGGSEFEFVAFCREGRLWD